ncbi:hypothetical protein GF1_00790 [Desulfolithobacter dissulfuricans]|uniref:Uncharacterized protein n=1 Tax=Desulfolithobacter dissulfuricans TaxID=2795293 RepID=A0A915TXE9_9BACT|nr:hypothetical protein [Desulfolithobacter dissulfuricans]BCO07703.1 hypothetical protein GF1_00790 [Desulfolithobacter dissulfuricans]
MRRLAYRKLAKGSWLAVSGFLNREKMGILLSIMSAGTKLSEAGSRIGGESVFSVKRLRLS